MTIGPPFCCTKDAILMGCLAMSSCFDAARQFLRCNCGGVGCVGAVQYHLAAHGLAGGPYAQWRMELSQDAGRAQCGLKAAVCSLPLRGVLSLPSG